MTNQNNKSIASSQNELLEGTSYYAFYEYPNFVISSASDGECVIFSETECYKQFCSDIQIIITD